MSWCCRSDGGSHGVNDAVSRETPPAPPAPAEARGVFSEVALPVAKRYAELLAHGPLEGGDGLGEGGLRDVQVSGGGADGLEVCERREELELPEGHIAHWHSSRGGVGHT